MMRYWIAVASREHTLRGVAGGFAQVCHGKSGPLQRMKKDDWLIYYSPTERFGEKSPCQRFTAIGRILSGEPYQYRMSPDFIPWRRHVQFLTAQEADIAPLIEKLSFIHNKRAWGYPFRYGFFSISHSDFCCIAASMNVYGC